MDIVVEDGTGLPTANSYISAADADDLLSVNIYATWTTLDQPTKEALLMWASRLLDERATWKGHKAFRTSGLAWPRHRCYDRHGYWIDDNIVPQPVKLATAVLANFLLVNAADPEAVDTSNNMTQLKVDVIELKFDPTILKNKYPTEVKYILKGLAEVAMGNGGPKRIILH